MNKEKICLLHPFTGSAIGIPEKEIPHIHSKPHVSALNYLAQLGYNCTIDYFTFNLFPYKITGSNLAWRFWPVSKKWHSDSKKWKKQYSMFCVIWFWCKPPDMTIINMSGHGSLFCFKLAKVLSKKKKKYIAMIGGVNLSITQNTLKYYQGAERILVHTKRQQEQLKKIPEFSKLRIDVFPLGVDCNKFIPSNLKNKNEPSLLFVGRVAKLKRIHLAIDVIKKLKEIGFNKPFLKIVGPISSKEYYNELNNLIINLKLEANISFEGLINHDDLISYYQSSDLLLLPSEHESFGMVAVESMACGVPVASIKGSGGPDEIITSGKDGLLTELKNYSTEVSRLFLTPDLINYFKTNARKTILTKYDLKQTDIIFHKLICECLS